MGRGSQTGPVSLNELRPALPLPGLTVVPALRREFHHTNPTGKDRSHFKLLLSNIFAPATGKVTNTGVSFQTAAARGGRSHHVFNTDNRAGQSRGDTCGLVSGMTKCPWVSECISHGV